MQIGREKLKETIEVEHWNHFMEVHLNPVWLVADNDVKDAGRRVASARARIKKEEDAGNTAADDDGSDVEGPDDDED